MFWLEASILVTGGNVLGSRCVLPVCWKPVPLGVTHNQGSDFQSPLDLSASSGSISVNELNYEQEEFLKSILTYVCENGDITKDIVVNEDPFASASEGFGGEYMMPLAKYVDSIHNAVVAG